MANLKLGDIIMGMGTLILVYLILTNWKGTNAILSTTFAGTAGLAKTLQGR
jgi:hypothetical protein